MNTVLKQLLISLFYYLGGAFLFSLSVLSFVQGILFHLEFNPFIVLPFYFIFAIAMIAAILIFTRATMMLKSTLF